MEAEIILYPLAATELNYYLTDKAVLESMTGYQHRSLELENDLDDLLRFSLLNHTIPGVANGGENWKWFTHWLIVDKTTKTEVGGIGISGLPDENGACTIGYFVGKGFRRKGYARAAIRNLSQWIFLSSEAKTINAVIRSENLNSSSVLRSVGFKYEGKHEEGEIWKLHKDAFQR